MTWSNVPGFPTGGTYAEDSTDPNGYLTDIQGLVWVTFDGRTGTAGSPTQTIYVGVADLGNSVYHSTDGGATWQAVPGQPTGSGSGATGAPAIPSPAPVPNGRIWEHAYKDQYSEEQNCS